MSKLTKEFLTLIPLGSRIIVKDSEDGDFEGTLNSPITFESSKCFTVVLDKCRRVGSTKFVPGSQEFDSDTIDDIEIVNDGNEADGVEAATKAMEQKMKMKEGGGKVYPVGGNVARKLHRNDNPHLDRLHPPQIPELVAQKQIMPPPRLHQLENQELTPRVLPVPMQEIQHMTGDKFKDRSVEQYRIIREATWRDQTTPPKLHMCPKKLYVIEEPTKAFDFAMDELENQTILGLSMQGKNLCRTGVLSVLLISTKEAVFLFDIIALTDKVCFDDESPLRTLLEDSGVTKVLHDSRIICDLLHHKYHVHLSNVYDTLASHVVFGTYAIYAGFMPKHTFPLTDMIRGYLGVKAQFLYFPHKRAYNLDKDTEIWLERPLPPHLELNAVYDVMYLLDLHRLTRKAMDQPFRQMTEVLMKDLRDANEIDNSIKVPQVHLLPIDSRKVLPNWNPNEGKASRFGMVDAPFVYQTTCQVDPMLNFSRDVIHQKKPPGPYDSNYSSATDVNKLIHPPS